MVTLSESQRQAVAVFAGQPVEVMDEQTQQVYYLLSSEQFQKVRALLADEPFESRELYPLIAKTAAQAGWADPRMDEYDRYDDL
ncbi:MAG: hypothetical protein HZA46_21300, partial [Planctomycetales bacterium]|nr:hypothetical protein [Planctomycetales bacterium]